MFFKKDKIPTIPYTLKRYKTAKSLKVRIKATGVVLVTAPYRLSKRYITNFVEKKAEWIQEHLDYFASLPQPHVKTKKGDYKKYKEQALQLVTTKIEKINQHYKFSYNTISIKNQKTRWGSCSSKKNLNFNYKIALIPDIHAEYIVIHELCHLKEMNHGENFWKLVEETMPDYKKIRKELHELKM
jgi:hypothetical protein